MSTSRTARSGRTKWIVLGGVALLLIATVMAVMLVLSLRSTGLGVVERRTGLDLPQRVADVDTFEDPGHFVIAHARLLDAPAFVSEQEFGQPPEVGAFEDYLHALEPQNRTLAEGPEIVGARGSSEDGRWSARFDPQTGRLWVVVVSPS